jgi:hypothetical protein
MKRIFMTLSAITLIGFAASAQEKKSDKPAVATDNVAPAVAAEPDVKQDNKPAKKADGGTRMAITQKGLPASKKVESKDPKPAATDPKTPPVKQEKH